MSSLFPPDADDPFDYEETEPLHPLLVVDDEKHLCDLLATIFTAGGYDVTCAEDGEEALEFAKQQRFPVVVTDLEMPRMDGIELVHALAELDPYTECILLSGSENLPRIIQASESGNVFNHFWKPLQEMGDLVRAVARALERRELRLSNAHLLSELRDTRFELHALSGRLEQLDKVAALGQMTGAVAQDMESPLKSLLAYAEYLRARLRRDKDEPLTPEQANRVLDYLQEMETSIQVCYRTVQGVLDYTQVHDAPPQPTDLHNVLAESVEFLRYTLEAQGVRLSLQFADELPPVRANRRRLQQALINLFLNAQQALGKGGGVITVATEHTTDSEAEGVRIRISDTGPGIAPGVLPHIFDPFFTTRPHTRNLGVGLTIARNIVREWRGDLTIESAPGKGVVATLTLPTCGNTVICLPNESLPDEPPDTQTKRHAA